MVMELSQKRKKKMTCNKLTVVFKETRIVRKVYHHAHTTVLLRNLIFKIVYILFMQFSSDCDFIAVNTFSLGFVNTFHCLT